MLPSVVWLPSAEFVAELGREVLQRSRAPGAIVEDGEVNLLSRRDESVRNVVEGGTQGVGNLSGENAQPVLGSVQLSEVVQVQAPFYVEAVGDAILVSLHAAVGLGSEVSEVFPRPIHSGIPCSPHIHEVHTPYHWVLLE